MKTIWKFVLRPDQPVTMPKKSRLLSVGVQGEDIVLWAQVESTASQVKRDIVVVPTGDNATTVASYPFVGTVQLHGLVFHVFDGGEQ